jgi:excisionase family DNA binding protein
MEALLTVNEVSQLTQLSVGTLYHLISQRRIPVVRLSARCVRFRLSDIEEWLAGKVIGPDGPAGIRNSEMGGTRAKKKSREGNEL